MNAFNLHADCRNRDHEGSQPDAPDRGYDTDPDDDAAKRRANWEAAGALDEPKSDPNWQVTVQKSQECASRNGVERRTVPGYVQIDDVSGGQNNWSKSPATLRKEGFNVPHFERLPQGRYMWAEACAMLRREGGRV